MACLSPSRTPKGTTSCSAPSLTIYILSPTVWIQGQSLGPPSSVRRWCQSVMCSICTITRQRISSRSDRTDNNCVIMGSPPGVRRGTGSVIREVPLARVTSAAYSDKTLLQVWIDLCSPLYFRIPSTTIVTAVDEARRFEEKSERV